jgi:hypothetical protein
MSTAASKVEKSVEQSAILLDLASSLRNRGSWAGETHLQKAAYVLQELLGVRAGFRFVLYKHGPFSFDLREMLSQMEAERLIRWKERQYPFGPSIGEGETTAWFQKRWNFVTQPYSRQVNFVAEQLGKCNVTELERLATALFVSLDPSVKPECRVQRLLELKPHIPANEAPAAFEKLGHIWDAANREDLAPTNISAIAQ